MAEFRLPERLTTFRFEDGEWAEAEIVCRLAPFKTSEYLSIAQAETVGEMITMWTGLALVSWNLALPDGTPITANVEGIEYLSTEVTLSLIVAWLEEVGGIPAPLLRRSPAIASSVPEEKTSPDS